MTGTAFRKEAGLLKFLSEGEASVLFFTFVSQDEESLAMTFWLPERSMKFKWNGTLES